MHELSLAMNVVKIVENEARKANAQNVNTITLEIGECSGVDHSIFDFSWPFAIKGTLAENAQKIIQTIDGRAKCNHCDFEFGLHKLYDPCPVCESFDYDILQGKEFRVKSISIN